MGSACPPHWTFAARAAYFGDRMCSFCEHRNPAGSKFCNECGSPLHLKPCTQCDAVNQQDAANCHNCGAACPASFGAARETTALRPADPTSASVPPSDAVVAETPAQPLFAASAFLAPHGLPGPGQFLVAAVGTLLIAGSVATYRINSATSDAMRVASQQIDAREHNTPATPAVPIEVESKRAEPERTASLKAPIPANAAEASKRASADQRPQPVPATKRSSAHQRPAPVPTANRASVDQRPRVPAASRASAGQRPVRVPATNRATPPPRRVPERPAHLRASPQEGLAAARAHVRVAERRRAPRLDPWLMHVSLARCGGDLIARIVCDQRVRRNFCEGHWGEAPECPSGIANDHGQ
jgi:hypothetical protein